MTGTMTGDNSERSGRAGRLRVRHTAVWIISAALLSGCGGGSSVLDSVSETSSSLGSRFSQLFGSNSQAAGEPSAPAQTAGGGLACPPVVIRSGASTYSVGLPGKPATGADVRFQANITRVARDCTQQGDQIAARIGIEGRVIVGPAGASGTVEIPLRIAVVKETAQGTKAIFTKFYRTAAEMPADGSNGSYSFVAEDIGYPIPSSADNEAYIYYIGFDPNGLKPEPAPRAARHSRPRS